MRPSSMERFRVNSPRPAYQANAENVNEETIDCGIQALKWCNTPWCRKLGTTTTFLTVLIFLAIVQGIAEKFVIISAQQAALEHDYDPDIIEWLLVSHGIFQGLFAILIAFWGNRIHKIQWLCGLVIFESVTSFLVIIPTIVHAQGPSSQSTIDIHSVNLLCENRISASFLQALPHSITTLVGLFLLQTGIAFGFIAYFTLGLTYLDDMALEHNSPALIAAALAARYIGIQLGYVLSLALHGISFGWWFGWSIISPVLFIIAIFIGLFPQQLLESRVRQAADTIVETATNSSQISLSRRKFLSDISFCRSIGRLFRNKILLLNIFATVFIEIALINYALQEQNYLQSRFLLPADNSDVINNEWTSRMLTKFIQPFGVALAILIGGLIIAKAKPSPRKIVAWNMIMALIVCLLFVGFIFIECSHNSIAGAYGKRLATPFCSRHCACDPDIRFTPVCPENGIQTFYSPCSAGCTSDRVVNGKRVFGNCSCGIDSEVPISSSIATEGACGYKNCQNMWIIFQVLSAFGAVCIGSRLVGKILISIRSVLWQDTALALALELTFVGLLAYIPGKIAYEYMADITCDFWSHNGLFCYLHDSHDFGNIVNILSAILSLIAVILEFIILFFVKDLELYGSEVAYIPRPIEIDRPTNEVDGNAPEAEQSSQPLLTRPNENEEPAEETPQRTDSIRGTPPIERADSPPVQRIDSLIPVTTQSLTTTTRETMSNRFVMSTASASSSVRYSPVYRAPPAPPGHIEELNMRLKALNGNVHVNIIEKHSQMAYSGDINPSVGSDTEKESDLNIRQLESSVSSLSGLPSSVNSPEMAGNSQSQWHVVRKETSF